VNRIQRLRKDSGLEITDRIALAISGPASLQGAAQSHRDFISGETLATSLTVGDTIPDQGFAEVREVDIDGTAARIALAVSG
jgi:hypothetical protein